MPNAAILSAFNMVKSESASKGIQSIEHGYRLLEALEHSGGGLSLKDLASAAGMSPSKAHFYLTSLVRVGLVSQAAVGGHYEFGPAAIRFGMAVLRSDFGKKFLQRVFPTADARTPHLL